MSADTPRIALIGCGAIAGRPHITGIRESDWTLAAVCDIARERAEAFKARLGTQFDEILAERDARTDALVEAAAEAERASMMHAEECKRLTTALAERMKRDNEEMDLEPAGRQAEMVRRVDEPSRAFSGAISSRSRRDLPCGR